LSRATGDLRSRLWCIRKDRVNLPRAIVRAIDPELVLQRIAAGDPRLVHELEAFVLESGRFRDHFPGRADLDADMVEAARLAGAPSMSTSFNGGSAIAKLA